MFTNLNSLMLIDQERTQKRINITNPNAGPFRFEPSVYRLNCACTIYIYFAF